MIATLIVLPVLVGPLTLALGANPATILIHQGLALGWPMALLFVL